jgi:hypothetical protein
MIAAISIFNGYGRCSSGSSVFVAEDIARGRAAWHAAASRSANRSPRWSGVRRSIVRLNGVLLFGWSTAVNFEVLRRTVRRGY